MVATLLPKQAYTGPHQSVTGILSNLCDVEVPHLILISYSFEERFKKYSKTDIVPIAGKYI